MTQIMGDFMPQKPAYEEIEKRLQNLEKENAALKEAQEAISASEELHRATLENISDTVIITDDHGKMIYVCPNTHFIFGLSQNEVHQLDTIQVLLGGVVCDISDLKEQHELKNLEWSIENSLGETRFLLINVKWVNINQGTVLYVMRDITDHKQDLNKYEAIASSTLDGVYLLDMNYRYVHVNKVYENFSGISHDSLVGLKVSEYLGQDLFENIIKPRFDKCLHGETIKYQEWIEYPTLGKRYMDVTYYPYRGSDNQILGIIVNTRDITERKHAEEDKKNLMAQLQQAQKMESIGTLAGGIAHDFNNILSSIMGFAGLVKQDLFEHDSELMSNIDQVIIAGHRATDLVQHILTFSRHSEIDKKPLLVSLLIKEAIKFLRASLPASIEIKTNIRCKDATILADATQIHQVVMNLCTNATQAMKKKGGVLTICLEKKTLTVGDILESDAVKPGDYLKLSVSDTGHGIPDECINRIFEPFFTTKKKGAGTGMGLSVVHGIIKEMGGTITVESEPGKGSAFHVMIPMHKTIPVHDTIAHDEIIQKGKGHVLYVDDEKSILSYADKVLQRAGYKVTTVNDSLDALVLFKSDPKAFDIVITDLGMPKMDGLEFSKRILMERPGIPIILSTGFSRGITQEHLDKIGIHKMIMKPVIVSALIETIKSAIKLNQ